MPVVVSFDKALSMMRDGHFCLVDDPDGVTRVCRIGGDDIGIIYLAHININAWFDSSETDFYKKFNSLSFTMQTAIRELIDRLAFEATKSKEKEES